MNQNAKQAAEIIQDIEASLFRGDDAGDDAWFAMKQDWRVCLLHLFAESIGNEWPGQSAMDPNGVDHLTGIRRKLAGTRKMLAEKRIPGERVEQSACYVTDVAFLIQLLDGQQAPSDAATGEPASKAGRLDEISRYRAAAAANQQQGATVEAQRYARDVAFLFAVIDEQRQTADAALKGLMQEATRRAYERGRAIAARPTQTFVTTGQLQYATQDEMRKAIEYGAAPRDEEAERNVLAAISFGTGDEPEDDDDDDEDEDTDLYAPPPDHEELGEAGATKDAVEQAIARHMPPEDEPPASCPCDDCNMARRLGLVASHDQVQQFGRVGLENLSAMTRPAPPIASADPAPGTLGALENTAKHLGEIMAPYAAMKTAPPIAPAILPPYDDGSGILLGNRVTDDNEADVRPVEPSCACASPTMHEPDCQWAIYRKRQRERA